MKGGKEGQMKEEREGQRRKGGRDGGREEGCREREDEGKSKTYNRFQSACVCNLLYVGWSNAGLSSFTFTMRMVTGVGTLLRGVRPLSATVSSRLV